MSLISYFVKSICTCNAYRWSILEWIYSVRILLHTNAHFRLTINWSNGPMKKLRFEMLLKREDIERIHWEVRLTDTEDADSTPTASTHLLHCRPIYACICDITKVNRYYSIERTLNGRVLQEWVLDQTACHTSQNARPQGVLPRVARVAKKAILANKRVPVDAEHTITTRISWHR